MGQAAVGHLHDVQVRHVLERIPRRAADRVVLESDPRQRVLDVVEDVVGQAGDVVVRQRQGRERVEPREVALGDRCDGAGVAAAVHEEGAQPGEVLIRDLGAVVRIGDERHQPVAHAPGAVADAAREARAAPVYPVARRVPVERQPVLARDRVVDRGTELVHALDRGVPAVPAEAHPVGVAEMIGDRAAENQGVRAVLARIKQILVLGTGLADVQVEVRFFVDAAGEFYGLVEGERDLDHLVPVERRPVARLRGDLRVDQRRRRLHLEDRREAVEMALLRGCVDGPCELIRQIRLCMSCHALAGYGVVTTPAVTQGQAEAAQEILGPVALAPRPDDASVVARDQRAVLPDPGITVPAVVVEVRVVVGGLLAPHPVDGLAGAVAVRIGVGVVSGVIVPGARQRIELIAEPVEVGMPVPGRRAHGAVVVTDVLRSAVARVLRDEHQPEGVAALPQAVRRQAPGERHVLLRRRRKRQERERPKPEQQRRRGSGEHPDTGEGPGPGERHTSAGRAGKVPHPAEPGWEFSISSGRSARSGRGRIRRLTEPPSTQPAHAAPRRT